MEINESIDLINRLRKLEADRIISALKGFAKYNLESTRLAFSGKEDACRRYLQKLTEESVEENDIEDQFRGVNFGE